MSFHFHPEALIFSNYNIIHIISIQSSFHVSGWKLCDILIRSIKPQRRPGKVCLLIIVYDEKNLGKLLIIFLLTSSPILAYHYYVTKKRKFKPLQISGDELDSFIGQLVEKLYNQIWADLAVGPDETAIKKRLRQSIVEALKEYAGYTSNE